VSYGKRGLARFGLGVVGAATALTLGLWAQSTSAQPSAPAQRIAAAPATAGAAVTASAAAASAPAGGGGSRVNVIARDY